MHWITFIPRPAAKSRTCDLAFGHPCPGVTGWFGWLVTVLAAGDGAPCAMGERAENQLQVYRERRSRMTA
jgi:hypothetical protein